jgi:hypothetical protein
MSKTLLVESLRIAFALPGIDEELTAKVEELLTSVELFFELLVSAYGDSHEADVELEHILKLMEFVKGQNRRDIYLKYLYVSPLWTNEEINSPDDMRITDTLSKLDLPLDSKQISTNGTSAPN